MGGFVRKIFKTVFSQPKPVIAPVAQTVAETSPVPIDVAKQKQAALGSGYGSKTILTSSVGDENEANVSKTILGGGKKKKIRA
jgi:hypothetical protein